jgi:hypothetical protein
MMNGFGLMLETNDRKEALREVRKWVDKELGEQTTSVKVEGNKTTVTLPDGRVGVSRCNPCDKFDIITGIRVALDDIERKSRMLSEDEKLFLKVAQRAGGRYVKVDKYMQSVNDVWFTNCEDDDDDYVVLHIEDDNIFNWLTPNEYYNINLLLKERS